MSLTITSGSGRLVLKYSPDQPRWPANAPYGLGGQFKPIGVSTVADYRAWLKENDEPMPEDMKDGKNTGSDKGSPASDRAKGSGPAKFWDTNGDGKDDRQLSPDELREALKAVSDEMKEKLSAYPAVLGAIKNALEGGEDPTPHLERLPSALRDAARTAASSIASGGSSDGSGSGSGDSASSDADLPEPEGEDGTYTVEQIEEMGDEERFSVPEDKVPDPPEGKVWAEDLSLVDKSFYEDSDSSAAAKPKDATELTESQVEDLVEKGWAGNPADDKEILYPPGHPKNPSNKAKPKPKDASKMSPEEVQRWQKKGWYGNLDEPGEMMYPPGHPKNPNSKANAKSKDNGWNPKKGDYTDAAWRKACVLPDVDGGKLPVRDPQGKLSAQGVRSAMKMLGSVKGISDEQRKKAASTLKTLAGEVGVEPTQGILDLTSGSSKTASKLAGEYPEGSFEWIRGKLQRALQDLAHQEEAARMSENSLGPLPFYWIKDIFPEQVVIEDESEEELYEASWQIDPATGKVTFGDWKKVSLSYVQKKREDASTDPPHYLETPIIKKNAAQRLAYGAVLVPGEPDSDGDVVSAEKISEVAHDFMLNRRYNDSMHEVGEPVAAPVESYISPEEMAVKFGEDGEEAVIPEGSWIMGVKVNEDYWPRVESGEIKGYSIMGVAQDDLASLSSGASGKSVDAAFKKTTLKDLGDDWNVHAVSLVDDPAVGKALFFSLKSKDPDEANAEANAEEDHVETNAKEGSNLGVFARLFGAKTGSDASASYEGSYGEVEQDEHAEDSIETQTGYNEGNEDRDEGSSVMAEKNGDQEITLEGLTEAITNSTTKSLREVMVEGGFIEKEKSPEELSEENASLKKRLKKALKNVEVLEEELGDDEDDEDSDRSEKKRRRKRVVVEDDEDEDEETQDPEEEDEPDPRKKKKSRKSRLDDEDEDDPYAEIRALKRRLNKVEKSAKKSKSLDSEDEDSEEEAEDDLERDMFGRRLNPDL